ncbi:hypothetical protein [Sinorhizobium meliloti]|uniref:hypothetical protein n=1 Tax=Rhizobium meliloti TaxID=382 RepID=UPI00129766B5|nr:hypothetical protein [Sinorhizobium meliloti]MDW9491726.1 hypothetical protein [Sinorhizobium meliloti]MQV02992.1 hypothetical protein [Sinorhizobium meliloti]
MNLNRETSTGAYLPTNEVELVEALARRGWTETALHVFVYYGDGETGDPVGFAAEINGPEAPPIFMFGFAGKDLLLKTVNVLKHRSLHVIE